MRAIAGQMVWDEAGWGYVPPDSADQYDRDYWDNYRSLDRSDMGDKLIRIRLDMVARYWDGPILDVGIGGGRFVREYPGTAYGYDVNPYAVEWLGEKYRDPYDDEFDAVTMWDSLEHINDPSELLQNVRRWVFCSLPIFRDERDARESKHYKPGEHVWYFTRAGLIEAMRRCEFEVREVSDAETRAGRESIESFVFERI